MRRALRQALAGGVLLWLGLPANAGAVVERSSSMRPAQGAHVVINEVQYDPPTGAAESGYEWIELFNPGDATVSLAGWRVADNQSADGLPDAALAPGAFLVVAAGDGFAELFPGFSGAVVRLGGTIGNGLGNSGDQVRLIDAGGAVIDALSYGDDASLLAPAPPDVAAGHSLERVPAGVDTDTAGDWQDQAAVSPGAAGLAPHPTEGPTAAPVPTLAPGVTVVVNEVLAAPRAVDWDGDGKATRDDEWIELYNAGDATTDVSGWQIDDIADGGSTPFVLPSGSAIPPRGYRVVFKHQSGIALNNDADAVRLLRPDGTEADAHAFAAAKPDASFARQPDGSGAWTDALPPSPAAANGSAAALPSTPPAGTGTPPGPTATPDPGATRSAPTPGGQTPGAPTPGAGTPAQPAPPPPAVYLPLVISEVVFDPIQPGDDSVYEWVELYNRSAALVDLTGWAIGDRVRWSPLPAASIPPGGFAVIAAGEGATTDVGVAGVAALVVAGGAIGNGLANRGDVVRLRGPTGAEADAVSYGGNLDAFDPAVPMGPPGASIERLPPDVDTDSAADWWVQPAPSPGRAGTRHDRPARVAINEVLPAPGRVDWDGDGAADHTDEWVEIYNAADFAVDLAEWRLEDRAADGWSYRFPPGVTLPAGGFRVVHRAASGIALDNAADTLRLIRPDGVEADRVSWSEAVGYDRSWSRSVDGDGAWTGDFAVTPGAPNRRRPPAAAPAAGSGEDSAPGDDDHSLPMVAPADAHMLPIGARVQIAGRVTVPPGIIDRRNAYIGDETGGIRVFLRPKTEVLPVWAEGEHVTVIGRLQNYHGEREVVLQRVRDAWSGGLGSTVAPADIATGALGESNEGRLIRLSGRVVAPARRGRISLDDGSGPAVVVFPRGENLRWSAPPIGARATVVGVVGQYAARAPWEGGYRVTPRRPSDVRGGAPVRVGTRQGFRRSTSTAGPRSTTGSSPYLSPTPRLKHAQAVIPTAGNRATVVPRVNTPPALRTR